MNRLKPSPALIARLIPRTTTSASPFMSMFPSRCLRYLQSKPLLAHLTNLPKRVHEEQRSQVPHAEGRTSLVLPRKKGRRIRGEERMTWIKTLTMEEDERVKKAMEAQRRLYPIEYATPVHPVNDGETSGIVASHSLIPDALLHAFSTFGALMSSDLPLTRRQHEMITTVVSVTNRCHY